MNKAKYVTVIDQNNQEVQAEILFTYEANGDQYVFYVIEETVFAARVVNPLEEDDWTLVPVAADEWKLLEKVYHQWVETDSAKEEHEN